MHLGISGPNNGPKLFYDDDSRRNSGSALNLNKHQKFLTLTALIISVGLSGIIFGLSFIVATHKPDFEKFRCISLAYEAIKKGGSCPVVLNVANDILVNKFLNDKINFLDIPFLIEKVLEKHDFIDFQYQFSF